MRASVIARAVGTLIATAACVASCSDDDGSPKNACEPSATRPCERDACSGVETCSEDGTAWGACVPCDGSGSGGSGADAGDAAPQLVCEPGVLPPRPSVQNAGGSRSFIAAMSSLSYGDSLSVVGFDLGEPSCATDRAPAVPDCSIDNALGEILRVDDTFSSADLTALVARGEMSTLVRVSEYTGTSDDDQVSVAFLVAAPFDSITPGATPAHAGLDDWPISSLSVDASAPAPLDAALYMATEAYVSGGQVAARFERAELRLPFGIGGIPARSFDVVLEDVQLSCEVARADSTWRLDGCVLGGLWPVAELLHELAESPDPAMSQMSLCTDSATYGFVLDFFCGFTGWSLEGSSSCGALPVGLSFATVPALATNIFQETELLPCPPEVDPITDSCPTQ